jgi:peptidoglycan hydrolase-like protein with peptidoglycan-binding domain
MPTAFTPLKQGSTGAAVRDLQQDLTILKYYTGAIDGVFGAKTKDAVVKFQQQNAVTVDGIVGYETEAAIERQVWIAKRPLLKQGATGQEVKTLQALLKEALEIAHSDLSLTNIDGNFGALTQAAVIKFQKSNNLTTDGVVGTATWKELSFIKSYDMSPEQIVLNGVFTNP